MQINLVLLVQVLRFQHFSIGSRFKFYFIIIVQHMVVQGNTVVIPLCYTRKTKEPSIAFFLIYIRKNVNRSTFAHQASLMQTYSPPPLVPQPESCTL